MNFSSVNFTAKYKTWHTHLAVLFVLLLIWGQSSPGSLVITPPEDFESSGQEGGPFSPSSKEYVLHNDGQDTLSWGADWIEGWIEVNPTWGSLDPNESITVLVSLTTAADSLMEGIYSDTVFFTDITHMAPHTRSITLTVNENTDPGLEAWWMLDETSGTIASDSSGNGYDGTLMNMDPNDWVTGKIGNC